MDVFNEKKIDELEAKIDHIITTFQTVKEENGKLVEKVNALEKENGALKEKMSQADQEKGKIVDKVKKILEKIEKIEV
jgi:regulator of replication initiation timing